MVFVMRFKMAAANKDHSCTAARLHRMRGRGGHVGTTSASACRAGSQLSPEPPSRRPLNTCLHRPLLSRTPFVKSCKSLLRFLLVATHVSHETDFQGALHDKRSQQNETTYELMYFDHGRKMDFLRSYFSLSTFELFFEAVHLAPPANTGSRVRHSSADQPPLRSRKHPLGLCSLSPQPQAKVNQSNREIEIVRWLLEQATLCVEKTNRNLPDLPGRPGWT